MTQVRRVDDVTGGKWKVQVKDLQRKELDPPQLFDAVVVCNGLVECKSLVLLEVHVHDCIMGILKFNCKVVMECFTSHIDSFLLFL